MNVARLSDEDSPFEEITSAQKDKYEKKYVEGDVYTRKTSNDIISSNSDNEYEFKQAQC